MISKICYLSFSSLLLLLFVLNTIVYESETIINGEKAKPGEFPSIVSLRNETGRHYCGGALVTNKIVVTAAHCLYEDQSVFTGSDAVMLKPENLKVVVGTLSIKPGGDTYEVKTIIPHPQYEVISNHSSTNDVGIIVLKKEVNNTNVIPTPISTRIPKNGTLGSIAGWGVLVLDESESDFIHQSHFPTELQKLSVIVQDKATCKKIYKENPIAVSQINTEYIICVEPIVDGSGICIRDSGSPLIVNGEFVGFAIGGFPCAYGYPDLFGSTAAYQDFIFRTIKAHVPDGSASQLDSSSQKP